MGKSQERYLWDKARNKHSREITGILHILIDFYSFMVADTETAGLPLVAH